MKTPVLKALGLISLAGAMVSGLQAVVVDFSNSTDLADNFRSYANSSSVSVSQGNNTFVTVNGATFATSPNILIYDTTPLDTTSYNTFALNLGQTLTVSIDIASITGAASSVGFYFLNSAQPLSGTAFSHNLALMNFDNSGTDELARFAVYASMTGQTLNNGTPSTGNGIALNNPTFQTVTATYTRDSFSNITMTLSTGAFTSTFTNNQSASFSNVGIALRLFPATGTPANSFLFDNFTVVPEPSTWALLGLGLGATLFFRRRKD